MTVSSQRPGVLQHCQGRNWWSWGAWNGDLGWGTLRWIRASMACEYPWRCGKSSGSTSILCTWWITGTGCLERQTPESLQEIFKNCLDIVLSIQILVFLFEQGVGQMDPEVLPIATILGFWDSSYFTSLGYCELCEGQTLPFLPGPASLSNIIPDPNFDPGLCLCIFWSNWWTLIKTARIYMWVAITTNSPISVVQLCGADLKQWTIPTAVSSG